MKKYVIITVLTFLFLFPMFNINNQVNAYDASQPIHWHHIIPTKHYHGIRCILV